MDAAAPLRAEACPAPPGRGRLVLSSLALILAGLAQALALALPWTGQPLWPLQVAALAVLAWQLRDATGWRAGAWRGLLFGTAWLSGTFWWLFISLHTYGGLPAPLTVLAVVGLAAFLASYTAAVCACFTAFAQRLPGQAAITFGALWLLAELMRTQFFTGFPWGAIGYAHIDGPMAGYAPWIGVHGIGALAAALAMGVAHAAAPGRAMRRRLSCALACVGVLALGAALQWQAARHADDTAYSAGTLQVALLQGNIPQDEKFQPGTGLRTALEWYSAQLATAQAALVVAPETAIPLLPQQQPEGYLEALRADFESPAPGTAPRAALVGMPVGTLAEGYTNAVLGFRPRGEPVGPGAADAAQTIGAAQAAAEAQPLPGLPSAHTGYRYNKHHLVPFGEFIPPMFKWFTQMMNIPLGDFNRGGLAQPTFDWQGQRLALNICYEDLFGEEIAASFVDATHAPTVMVNLSNIGWFGDSIAIDQHLQISRMRTLEFARPMLRATNTGATAVIDHRGVVLQQLPRLTRGVLVGTVEGRTAHTAYAWWVSRWGLWPFWLVGLVVAVCLRRRRT